jgi:ribonucleoside-diphosphate reductase subunit M1
MYYLRTRPKADAIQFTVNQEMLAETNQNPAENTSLRNSPTSIASGKVMKDEEEECLNCGA